MAGLSKAGQLQALFAASFALLLQSQVACRGESAPPGPNPPTNQVTPEGKDTNSMPWVMLEVPQINAKIPIKDLQADKDTGMQVFLVKYPAGFINTWHTHPNAHGMYVLEGTSLVPGAGYGSQRAAGCSMGPQQSPTLRSCSSRTKSSELCIR
jgi:hypothetical protein